MSADTVTRVAISDDAEDGPRVMGLEITEEFGPLLVYLEGTILDLSCWPRDELARWFATAAYALAPESLGLVEAEMKEVEVVHD